MRLPGGSPPVPTDLRPQSDMTPAFPSSTPSPLRRRPAEGVHVLLVGSRPMIREGLGRCLRARGCQIIGEASTGDDALRQALRLRPHVVVVDGSLDDAAPFDLARHLTAADRRQRILMVACHDEPTNSALHDTVVRRAWDSGLHGIVEPESDADHLAQAVLTIRNGGRHLPPRPTPDKSVTNLDGSPVLTTRECQVLSQIAHGFNTVEAGRRLVLSPATIKHHLSSAHRKLGARSRVEAVMMAVTRGMIEVDPTALEARREVTPERRPG